jgi:hypothetical protein
LGIARSHLKVGAELPQRSHYVPGRDLRNRSSGESGRRQQHKQGRKQFFSAEENQKTFFCWRAPAVLARHPTSKRFCVFFQKEVLASRRTAIQRDCCQNRTPVPPAQHYPTGREQSHSLHAPEIPPPELNATAGTLVPIQVCDV